MNKLSASAFFVTLSITSIPALAQSVEATVDDTQSLPNARPGECYAKVVTPAKFETRTEEIVVQEGSETIETTPATYENIEERVLTRDASKVFTSVPATYDDERERVEVRAAEANWVMSVGGSSHPASPGAIEGIEASGVDLDTVPETTCFREYYTPAEYRSEEQRIIETPRSEEIVVTPAVFEKVEEKVVVKEATSTLVKVPAVYRTETESVLVEPARSVWKKGRGPLERIDDTTGEILCLVEIPARFETITRSVLETAASTTMVEVPAVYETVTVERLVKPASENRTFSEPKFKTISKQVKTTDAGFFWLEKGEAPSADATYSGREVCLVPRPAEFETITKQAVKTIASVSVVEVPAQYETVEVQRLVKAAEEKRTAVPQQTQTVTRQTQVSPPTLVWRRVLCETNVTPEIIRDLQVALKREGFDPGEPDGVLGRATLVAVKEYQEKNSLDVGGVTYEALKALKVQR